MENLKQRHWKEYCEQCDKDKTMDYFEEENDIVKDLFNLNEILDLQMNHDIQIIREADWQYMCYIDRKGFASALTPLGALVFGVKKYKEIKNGE